MRVQALLTHLRNNHGCTDGRGNVPANAWGMKTCTVRHARPAGEEAGRGELCVSLSFLAGRGCGADGIITKHTATLKGSAWSKGSTAGGWQLFRRLPCISFCIALTLDPGKQQLFPPTTSFMIQMLPPFWSTAFKMYASNPPHLTNSHLLLPLLEPSGPQSIFTLQKAN